MPKKILFTLIIVILWVNLGAQSLSLDNIFIQNKYRCAVLDDFRLYNDTNYIGIEANNLICRSFKDTSVHHILVSSKVVTAKLQLKKWKLDDYDKLGDGLFMLKINAEPIYRRSVQYQYALYDSKTHSILWYSPEKVMYAEASPDCRYITYVKDYNMYMYDIKSKKNKAITTTGTFNELQYGMSDWMYEEEFYLTQAYSWNNSSTKIAYLSFDISEIKTFSYTQENSSIYPETVSLKYPKAGEPIASVHLHIYDIKKKKTLSLPISKDYYVPKIFWKNDDEIAYLYMPRMQNELYVRTWDGITEQTLYKETSNTFIELPLAAEFDKEESLIITSNQSNYCHLYLVKAGKPLQVTSGNYNVTQYYGYFSEEDKVLFQSNEPLQVDKSIYFVNIYSKQKNRITPHSGTYNLKKIGNKYLVLDYSSSYIPHKYYLTDYQGNILSILQDNDSLKDILPSEKAFFYVQKDDYSLPSYYILPPNYDSTQQYPLLVYCYGGPSGEEVTNEWQEGRNLWLYYMAEQGYIIACTDNRGVGNIDKTSNTAIYGKLGTYEVEDQADMVVLMTQKFNIDTGNINIFGWSYGGYLAAKCLMERPDIFKKAVAIAPVTDWKFYDAAYTERYMGLPLWNTKGYENASLLHNTYKIQGKLLLIHGTADDNVHFQNTLAFIQELQKQQKDFQIMIYSDKNHSIAGTFTRYHLFKTIGDFIMHK